MDRLAGNTAFITGGARGIGLGIARALAREGVKLALADVHQPSLAEARAALSALTDVEVFELDVRDRAAFAAVAAEAEQRLGPVTLLFNNAGVVTSVPPARMTYALWDWVLGVNIDGVVNGIQTFLPRMIERGVPGHVVNTSSGAGLVGGNSGFLYATSKFAVVGMSEALQTELAPLGIGVSVLCPGPVATGIVDHAAALRPDRAPLDPKTAAALKAAGEWLQQGTSPDDVGRMVVDAIRANRLYIYTDELMAEPIRARTKRLLEALPSALRPR